MRILIVDENAEDRDRIGRLLDSALGTQQLTLTYAGNRDTYTQALDSGSFDLIITEHALSWTEGLVIADTIRERLPGLPVIMVTRSGHERLAIEALRAGLQDYVHKDGLEEDLVPAIWRAVNGNEAKGAAEVGRRRLLAEVERQAGELALKNEELERVCAELQSERELLQTILDRAPVMLTLYAPKVETFTVNEHVERLTGWTEADRAETHVLDLCYPDPDYRAAVLAYRESLAPGYRDLDMMTKRGDVIQASWANIQLPDGRRMGIGLDVTESKRAERELQQSVAEFTALFHQMTEGLVLFDPQGNLLDMNPAARAIHGLDDLEGLTRHLSTLGDTFELFDLESDRLLSTDEWPIGRVLRGETFARYEVRVRLSNTGKTWIGSYGGTPVYGPDGELLLAIVTLRDITAQREAEEALQAYMVELEAVNDANRMLLREVNHRVKNNLTAILGLIYSEQRRLGQEAGCTSEQIRCQVALGDLAERVRSLATAHSLLSAHGWRPLRADELVEAVIEASVPAASDAESLVLDVIGTPLSVTPEQAHCLALIVGELTTNTLKYGRGADRLHITVELGLEDTEARFIYRNSGAGYPEEVLAGEGHSVGLGLIKTLSTHNLRGSCSIRNEGGPVTEIRFPVTCKVT